MTIYSMLIQNRFCVFLNVIFQVSFNLSLIPLEVSPIYDAGIIAEVPSWHLIWCTVAFFLLFTCEFVECMAQLLNNAFKKILY